MPFQKTIVGFNLGEWRGAGANLLSTSGATPLPMKLADWNAGADDANLASPGQGKQRNAKTNVFSFRLRIDNPNNPTGKYPYIYGEMSDQFKVYPKLGNTNVYGPETFYGWKINRAHYAKNR
jgi:hypothetical protein